MGCSSSTVSPEQDKQAKGLNNKHEDISKVKQNARTNNQLNRNVKSAKFRDASLNLKNQQVDKNGNQLSPLAQTPVPKSIAFDVTLDGHIGDGLKNAKKRPPRLQALEPLNIPKLTAEQLQEKQRLADDKREKLKQRKIHTSQKSSRRMRELNKAREFELSRLPKLDNDEMDYSMKQAESNREQRLLEVKDSIKQAESNREQRLLEVKDKQRLREDRAIRTRERAKQMHNPEDDAEIEKDEEFNIESDDTWLGIPDTTNKTDMEEEYGLQKRAGQMRQTVSSTTIDSYDAAFMRDAPGRQNLQSVHNLQNNIHIMNDDFFDS